MGLMEEFGAWLDQKKKNIAVNAQNLPGLLASFAEEVKGGAAADKSAWEASRSVMPEVRERGVREMNARGQELGAMAPAGLLGWTAYHGSPHKFDKFDLSNIGTGEGAQAYGHGLYFADNPTVAKEYAKLNPITDPTDTAFITARTAWAKGNTDPKAALKYLDELEQTTKNASGFLMDKGASSLSDIAKARELIKGGAMREPNIYKVDISDALAPQDAFLQWDKPLSEQPEAVKKLVESLPYKASNGQQLVNMLEGLGRVMDHPAGGKGASGVSGYLKAHGIPGIRYLDGGSRGAGSGTMNTVLFDDSMVKILERNGVPVKQPGLLAREPTKYQLAHAEAQRNAALPVAKGGLGLGPQNTAMERAKAMGFDTDVYHGTIADPKSFGGNHGSVTFTSRTPEIANKYAGGDWTTPIAEDLLAISGSERTPQVLPLKFRGDPGAYTEVASRDPSAFRSRFAAFDPKKKDSRDLLASMGLLGLLGAGAYGSDYQ